MANNTINQGSSFICVKDIIVHGEKIFSEGRSYHSPIHYGLTGKHGVTYFGFNADIVAAHFMKTRAGRPIVDGEELQVEKFFLRNRWHSPNRHGLLPSCLTDLFNKFMEIISRITSLSKDQILSDSRKRSISDARFLLVGLIFDALPSTKVVDLAALMDRHHTSVIYAKVKCSDYMESDKRFIETYKRIKNELLMLNNE